LRGERGLILRPLTARDKKVHEQGLVSVLKQVHDDLDAAVANAYGWPAAVGCPGGAFGGHKGTDVP
jgi:hypothetical protein